MALRHYGTSLLRHYGTTALWHYDTMALLHYDTIALRHYGIIALRHYGTIALRHYGTMAIPGVPGVSKSKTVSKEKQQKSAVLPTSLMSFFMSGSGSHWLVPVLKVVKFLHYQIIHVKPEQQQIRTWVIDLSRSQLAIAIMTSKSHQLLGSIQKSSFLVWPISRLCNTWTGS